MSNIENINTFWQIISEHQIEIPVIQRDYAQGRNTERITEIREKLIIDISAALLGDKDQGLHLDFVYGRIEGKDHAAILARNKNAVKGVLSAVKQYAETLNLETAFEIRERQEESTALKSTKLIPLDGQQRLTTLYLLHWYTLMRLDLPDKKALLETLQGFRYKTRKSTMQFCAFLARPDTLRIGTTAADGPLSKQVRRSTYYFKIWDNDPSVKGMLVMLDALHNQFRDADVNVMAQIWDGLTFGKRVTFDFLDLDKLDQTDELYVKMNARGKQLTDFEHFKAWLIEHIKKMDPAPADQDWEEKIDTTWLDMFWRKRASGSNSVDKLIYNFIKSVNLYQYVNSGNEAAVDKKLIETIREQNRDKNFIPLRKFEQTGFFTATSLDFLFKVLDTLIKLSPVADAHLSDIFTEPFTSGKPGADRSTISSFYLKDNQFPQLTDRVYYYAFILFIIDFPDLSDPDNVLRYQAWMRMTRNLIYNTYIQNPDNFINAIRSIRELSEHKSTIEDALLNKDIKVSFFESQAREEKLKLRYFRNAEWKAKILEYENHPYFYGQIKFIFDLLGDDRDDRDDLGLFIHYGDKLAVLFNGDIERNHHLLQRALLAKGDYTVYESNNRYSFCKSDNGGLRVRNDNWRKVFDNKDRLSILKTLLDDQRHLSEIMQDHDRTGWEKYAISCPVIISYCKERLFDRANKDGLDIRLLKGTSYSGKHTDMYLLVLEQHLKQQSKFDIKHVDVNFNRRPDNYARLEITNRTKDLFIFINYSYSLEGNKKGFEIRVDTSRYQQEIASALSGFMSKDQNHYYAVVNEIAEMDNVLTTITESTLKLENLFS
ncbi:DUF262 domain-containing protein [Mucilaginibacter lutimaris]|uniref:DUF262 domain-containing protein n=1 Tax=Mucilaginibacter lutimaris TaxID=931629 RepID=A0ABW2ZM11_9SPHI